MRVATRPRLALTLLAATLAMPACGRKTDVRPPEFVAPATIETLAARNVDTGVALIWRRPGRTADGGVLFDLDAFIVERALPGEPFAFLARVPVPDRDRLRQQKRFGYLDETPAMGEALRYRVLAITLDGYVSQPSNVIDIVRAAPLPTPTTAVPNATPAR